ncbi:hypothetical protein BDY21DRAFT_344632 [Lineolata rhizophorae]|uniref:MINDY deubiquitinase domain-containing protein n=1 Tax=Lineolata rhizophorae TaxID=578093 RepID=A0A6A6NZ86_9PEZI|nr:hypothetical protein BDY21DRAFT_344632 [Lineolata rhizophorae]
MVRKPDLVPPPLQQAANNPPYPTESTIPTNEPHHHHDASYNPPDDPGEGSSAFKLTSVSDALRSPTANSESHVESDNEWDTGDEDDDDDSRRGSAKPEDLPAPLKIGGGKVEPAKSHDPNTLPAALRPGPPGGGPPAPPQPGPGLDTTSSSWQPSSDGDREPIPLRSQNPYLRMQNTGQSACGGENSASVWGDVPSSGSQYNLPSQSPAELPSEKTPIEAWPGQQPFGSNSPATTQQPPLIPVETGSPHPSERQDSNASSTYNPGMDISSLDAFTSRNHGLGEDSHRESPPSQRTWQEQQDWEKQQREERLKRLSEAQEKAARKEQERMAEEAFHRGEAAAKAAAAAAVGPNDGPAPQLPPRPSQENPPPKPPRPQTGTSSTSSNNRRREHYQIKNIRWYDAASQSMRKAPILVQNANGPCPLLALVNALVLSTPAGQETALIEALRTREQISLGLLLDAVFDELTSGRRGGSAQELPDVGDLYAFLITLHTGMNVNPSFISPAAPETTIPNLIDAEPLEMSHVHPVLRSQVRLGGFESTREMKLYSTFTIPLIHGWLPRTDCRAYAAFERAARTYEDAQNIQFREEELESKLRSQGLSPAEQQLFEDLMSVKEFLARYPTQLTDHGLEVMAKELRSGQIAILFRNDHFTTLYKEPRSQQLLTLVTDAGYANHEEIVWESLVDVNGKDSELYSGDFRPVGSISDGAADREGEREIRSLLHDDDNVDASRLGDDGPPNARRHRHQASAASNATATPSNRDGGDARSRTEQEDHDLALALQLQEEEEARHQREQAERRRREDERAAQLLSQEGANNSRGRQEVRPLIPPRRNRPNNVDQRDPGDDQLPPPTYEQAASGPPYHPPRDHPASPHAPLRNPTSPPLRNQSAYAQQASFNPGASLQPGRRRNSQQQLPTQYGVGPGGRMGRRQSSAVAGPNGSEDREKCIVM